MEHFGAYAIPLVFVAFWLFVTSILGAMTGWFTLMKQFPNRSQRALLRLGQLSGNMGFGVAMNGILSLSVCPDGLRVGIWRIFGPFCRPFFVPWSQLTVSRREGFFGPRAELRFGHPEVGRLTVPGRIADRLGRAAAIHWPEPGPWPRESMAQIFRRLGVPLLIVVAIIVIALLLGVSLDSTGSWRASNFLGMLFPVVIVAIVLLIRFVFAIFRR